MRRSTFLLVTSAISVLFGGMMSLTPGLAAEGFGVTSTPETVMLIRAVGEPVLAMGLLCFLVRNDADSRTLRSVLILNVLYHAMGLANDAYSIAEGTVALSQTIPGILAHLFIGGGSLLYALRVDTSGARSAGRNERPVPG